MIAEVRDFIKDLSVERGKTILISSHILSEIQLLADDIGIIALVARMKKGYWLALVFAEIYSFAGLFTSMSNIWKVVYPITAVFNLSGYYQATALEMIGGCLVLVLCGTFRSCVKRIKTKFIERKWRRYKSRRQCNRNLHTRFSISVKILVFSLRKNQGGFVTFLFLT